mmetsp:Transcript_24980/g.70101  ORF Transcript_24980/g.70101 Transcript_24980/m.70101 type:complete len:210 (-) Transcript_24980:2873-3502(-)
MSSNLRPGEVSRRILRRCLLHARYGWRYITLALSWIHGSWCCHLRFLIWSRCFVWSFLSFHLPVQDVSKILSLNSLSTFVGERHLDHSIRLSCVFHQVPPIRIHYDRLTAGDHKEEVLRTSQGHIHTTDIAQKPDTMTSGCSDSRKDDDIRLAALKRVHGIHFHKLIKFVPQKIPEHSSEHTRLLAVRSNDCHAGLGRLAIRDIAKRNE